MAFTKVVGPGIHTLSNITSHNVHSSGIITATRFDGPFTNLNVTGVTTFAGDVSIGGTLTYEDVTNIDSVGIVTAREGIFIPDTKEIKLGNTAGSPDMKIHHDGNHSIIEETGTGNLFLKTTGSEISLLGDGGSDYMVRGIQNGATEIYHNAVKKLETTSSGVTVTGTVTDSKGDVRKIPITFHNASTYTLLASDAGKTVSENYSGGNITVPNSTFVGGDAVTIMNHTGGNQTITQGSGLTLYNSADGSTGNRTLAQRGMATIFFREASVAYISGSGLS